MPNLRDALGDRMKAYEVAHRQVLTTDEHVVIRVDGRSFHTLLRHHVRPFDMRVVDQMNATAQAMCEDMSGAAIGYVQSDEISVILPAPANPKTQMWFGGVLQKMVSVAASLATAEFNARRLLIPGQPQPTVEGLGRYRRAQFDARVFTLPALDEVANYLLWRQRDAQRNSISMCAQARFSHKALHEVNSAQMLQLLDDAGAPWSALPAGLQRGHMVLRQVGELETSWVDKRTGEPHTGMAVRSWWEVEAARPFDTDRTWLLDQLVAAGARDDRSLVGVPD